MSLAFVHAHDCSEPHTEAIWGVAWTSTDTTVSISSDGSIKQWAAISGQPQPHLPNAPSPNSQFPPQHTLALVSLSVSPDGKDAVYNSIEGLTTLWDLENGQVVAKYESYNRSAEGGEPAWSVSLSPNKQTYASTGASGNVTVRSAQRENFGEEVASLNSGRTKFGMCCKHSPDGRRLAMSSETGQIYIFDLESNSLLTTFVSHAMSVRDLGWSPDGNLLISASEDKRINLHDTRASTTSSSSSGASGGGVVASFTGHSSWVLSADVSPDSRLVVSGSADKTIKVWDLAARTCVSTTQDTGEVWSVSWRPKPPAVGTPGAFVSGGEDGVVKWWRGAGSGGQSV